MPINRLGIVPATDGTNNTTTEQVVGSKNDIEWIESRSLAAFAYAVYNHIHSSSNTHPANAQFVTVTSGGTQYVNDGAITEIIAADEITIPFDLHFVIGFNISAIGSYDVVVYSGASGDEIEVGRTGFTRSTNQSREGATPIQIPKQPANTRISASLISSNNAANTINVRVWSHGYTAITPL